MSANSTSSYFDCFTSNFGIAMIVYFLITKMIVLTILFIPVFYVGYQQWRQGSLATTSHSDIFTYHFTAIQLIFVLGTTVVFCGINTNNSVVFTVGLFGVAFAFPGEIFFNIITCVEHYLAVVHPVTYLGLRQSGGVRIRNICIGFGWLLCFGWLGVDSLYGPIFPYVPYFCVMGTSLIIVSFCCISVLCALIRPGPGEMGEVRKKTYQSKQKAFYIITAIMAFLVKYFLGMLVAVGLNNSNLLNDRDKCLVLLSANWFNLPISLILPLLFVQRRGKLSCSFFGKK